MVIIKLYCPFVQTVKKGRIEQLQLKGDPMHRPVMSREVGFLVRWLVLLSEWLNSQLRLDQPPRQGEMGENAFQVWVNLLLLGQHDLDFPHILASPAGSNA